MIPRKKWNLSSSVLSDSAPYHIIRLQQGQAQAEITRQQNNTMQEELTSLRRQCKEGEDERRTIQRQLAESETALRTAEAESVLQVDRLKQSARTELEQTQVRQRCHSAAICHATYGCVWI